MGIWRQQGNKILHAMRTLSPFGRMMDDEQWRVKLKQKREKPHGKVIDHTGNPPKQCLCGEVFPSSTRLRKHIHDIKSHLRHCAKIEAQLDAEQLDRSLSSPPLEAPSTLLSSSENCDGNNRGVSTLDVEGGGGDNASDMDALYTERGPDSLHCRDQSLIGLSLTADRKKEYEKNTSQRDLVQSPTQARGIQPLSEGLPGVSGACLSLSGCKLCEQTSKSLSRARHVEQLFTAYGMISRVFNVGQNNVMQEGHTIFPIKDEDVRKGLLDEHPKSKAKVNLYTWLVSFTSGLGGFLFGYEIGIINQVFTMLPFKLFFGLITYDADSNTYHSSPDRADIEGWITFTFLIGAALGALIVSYPMNLFG
ncbi:hypothetical protein PROFUN_16702, partial [Planoprotostelium fungivorum]